MREGRKIAGTALILILLAAIAGCKKYTDTPGNRDDPRFARKYCNVPSAVNYNWNFPGTPDSSDAVCFYATDVFKGNFLYTDSIYDGSDNFIRNEVKSLNILANTRTNMTVHGFCSTASLLFTANRNFRADADSIGVNGQLLCRNLDTLSGYIYKATDDSNRIQFSLRVGSDTGVFFHRGSAVKQ